MFISSKKCNCYCLFTLFLCLTSFIYALPLTYSTTFFDYGNVQINIPNQRYVTISNIYSQAQEIYITSHSTEVTVSNTNLLLDENESQTLTITFTGKTNIHYQTAITLENQFHHTPDILTVTAQCSLPNNEYPTTYNLYDNELKTALLALVNNHTSLGYDGARRTMYGTIDNIDGFVECVYTGQQFTASSVIADMTAQGVDCEHTWPQSLFPGNLAAADLNHIFPTTSASNNARGNLPFGVVVGTPNWEMGGSKRGVNSANVACFEPRDYHKGKVARAMIYFAIRYDNPYSPFFDNQEAVLKQWNRDFAVTTIETNRNNAINTFQNKKNPFIVHPAFADRIYSISTSATIPITLQLVYPSLVTYDAIDNVDIPLFNNGNGAITISGVTANNAGFVIQSYSPSIPQKQVGHIILNITQTSQNPISVTLTTNAGTYIINLQYNPPESISDDTVFAMAKPEIYPNPVKNNLQVKTNTQNVLSLIEIYNIRGQKVHSGSYNATQYTVDLPPSMTSGLYFLRFSTDKQVYIHKFIHIK